MSSSRPEHDSHRYIIFGPQGSGKGTQAELLAEELNVPHIATGDLFRDEVARGTALGKRIEADIESGKLMPDDDADALVTKALNAHDNGGYVLDGFPRTLTQAKYLDTFAPPTRVVLLELDDDESVKRIGGRRVCSNCKHVYHLMYHPPKDPTMCDACGGKLVIRGDDHEGPIRARLRIYHSVTEPVDDYYNVQDKLKRLSAAGSIFEVKAEIRKALNLHHLLAQ